MTDNLMMKTSNVHLVIVTGQSQPNLIPILQFKNEVKFVGLAVSQEMKEKANGFEELLKRLIPGVQTKQFKDLPSGKVAAIEKRASEIELEIKQDINGKFSQEICYHATGGNKLMALGFYAVFAKEKNTVIYTDTANNQIEFVYPRGREDIQISYHFNIKTYLLSLGFTHKSSADDGWKNLAKKRKKTTTWLVENAEFLDLFLNKMNGLANKAMPNNEKRVENPEQFLDIKLTDKYKEALNKLKITGLLNYEFLPENRTKIIFNTANHTKYIKGIWLEEYMYLLTENLGIQEIMFNVKFSRSGIPHQNEMDCIALHNNRLLAIECKTATLESKDTKDSNNILLKLEALGKGIGGLYHEEWLVSARTVSTEVEERAKAAKMEIVHPSQLKDLKIKLEKWVNATR